MHVRLILCIVSHFLFEVSWNWTFRNRRSGCFHIFMSKGRGENGGKDMRFVFTVLKKFKWETKKIQFRLYSLKQKKQLLAYSLLGFFAWRRFRVRDLFWGRYSSKTECAKELSWCFKFAKLIVILYKVSGFHAFGTYWKKGISSEKEVLVEKLYEVTIIAIIVKP